MIQSISAPVSNGAPVTAGVGAAPGVRRPETEPPVRSRAPAMDEYIPEEKQAPSGRYWPGRDEDGQPKLYFDDPEQGGDAKAAGAPKQEAASGKETETCTGSTDQVDREIEQLKKEKEQLEQRLRSEADEANKNELEARLAQVENELRQKDNDGYRRQHMAVS